MVVLWPDAASVGADHFFPAKSRGVLDQIVLKSEIAVNTNLRCTFIGDDCDKNIVPAVH
jgi:hypothetical protein